MAIKYNFTMTKGDIDSGITSVGKSIASTKKRAHLIMASVLYRWHKDGAANVAAQQATAILAEWDAHWKQGIVNWFGEFAGFEYDEEKETFVYTETTIDLAGVQKARAINFEKFTPPPAPKAFKLDERIANLIDLAEKRAKSKNPHEDDDINQDHLMALKKLIA